MNETQVPICGCGRFMNRTASNVVLLTRDSLGNPHELWWTNEYQCPADAQRILLQSGERPITEHWKPDFEPTVRQAQQRQKGGLREARHFNTSAEAAAVAPQTGDQHVSETTKSLESDRTPDGTA